MSSYLLRKARGEGEEILYKLGDNCWIKVPEEKGRSGIQILSGRTCLGYSEMKIKKTRIGIGSLVVCSGFKVGNKY